MNLADSDLSNETQCQPEDSGWVWNGDVPALGHGDQQSLWPYSNMILNTCSISSLRPDERVRLTSGRRIPLLLFTRHGGDGGGGWEVAVRSAGASLSADTISVFHVLSSMPTSELSDALNPNVVRQRNYDDVLVYQDRQAHSNLHHPNFHYEQPPQQSQYEYVPHRSELELAVVEPTPTQRYALVLLPRLRCSDNSTDHDLSPLTPYRSSYGYGPI